MDSTDRRTTALGRLATGLVLVVGAATLVGFLDRVSWVFEAATLFRLQYAVVLAVAGFGALALRRWWVTLAAALLVGMNVAAIAPWRGAPHAMVLPGDPTLRIVSFNVNAGNHRYGELAPLVRQFQPDILGLTELTPAWARAARDASRSLKPRRLVVQSGDYGMGLFSVARPIAATVERFPARDGPVALIARYRVDGRPVTFVLVHAHTPFAGSVHERELRALAAARPRLGRRLIVCGDFNTVPWSAQFGEFAESTGLSDVSAGSWPAYSWPVWSPALRVPLDHCLISGGLAVRAHRFGPSAGSDHFPLVVDLVVTA
jgi:endonuclease/exonuclease/phosphatase (EEP) superfamily protein YafD